MMNMIKKKKKRKNNKLEISCLFVDMKCGNTLIKRRRIELEIDDFFRKRRVYVRRFIRIFLEEPYTTQKKTGIAFDSRKRGRNDLIE